MPFMSFPSLASQSTFSAARVRRGESLSSVSVGSSLPAGGSTIGDDGGAGGATKIAFTVALPFCHLEVKRKMYMECQGSRVACWKGHLSPQVPAAKIDKQIFKTVVVLGPNR